MAAMTVANLAAAPSFRIAVYVQAPELLKNRIESALLTELRKNSDVSVVPLNSEYGYRLDVLCISRDESVVISCSYIGTEPAMELAILGDLIPNLKGDHDWKLMVDQAKDTVRIDTSRIITMSKASLDELAESIAADFNLDVLEPDRKRGADIERFMQTQKQAVAQIPVK